MLRRRRKATCVCAGGSEPSPSMWARLRAETKIDFDGMSGRSSVSRDARSCQPCDQSPGSLSGAAARTHCPAASGRRWSMSGKESAQAARRQALHVWHTRGQGRHRVLVLEEKRGGGLPAKRRRARQGALAECHALPRRPPTGKAARCGSSVAP